MPWNPTEVTVIQEGWAKSEGIGCCRALFASCLSRVCTREGTTRLVSLLTIHEDFFFPYHHTSTIANLDSGDTNKMPYSASSDPWDDYDSDDSHEGAYRDSGRAYRDGHVQLNNALAVYGNSVWDICEC
jgi:hypothetical protein